VDDSLIHGAHVGTTMQKRHTERDSIVQQSNTNTTMNDIMAVKTTKTFSTAVNGHVTRSTTFDRAE